MYVLLIVCCIIVCLRNRFFVMVKSNLDDFAGPEQSFFAERFLNSLIYGTEDSVRN